MKLFDWIKKVFKINDVKQIEEPKEIDVQNSWKESIQYSTDTEYETEPLTEEQIRVQQIMATEYMVLFKEGYLLKEDIIKNIQKKYNDVILTDVDVQSLISIHGVMKYEDLHGDYNIREFIEEDGNNIVRLVDKLVEHAKEEAKKYEVEDIAQFVTADNEIINQLKNDIMEENEIKENNKEDNEEEIENEQ